MNRILRMVLYGFLIWLVCFIFSVIIFPLNESHFMLFKTIMIVSGMLIGMWFLILYVKKVDSNYLSEMILAGIIWFVVNLLLDFIVLVGAFKMPVTKYVIEIGIRYLNIPILTIGVGFILSLKNK